MEISKVQEFYKDTKIFITGATGFVGKTLIEKLLRVTDVDTIYLLIREKKGKTSEERLNKMFDNPLFEVLNSKKPNFRSKIKAVIGECGSEGLTISASDREEIKANVNILFHTAATVNFDENLKTAYDINVKGTIDILNMAKEMPKLKVIVYVSTAFSNCNTDKIIEEKIYDYPFDDVITQIETGTKEDFITPKKIIGKWPNTYTFTKAITEYLIKREGKDLPIGIFRPSIIVSTYQEPIPGWLDNIYAINGLSLGVLTGFLRVLPFATDMIVDAVPVDMCISALAVVPLDITETNKTMKNKEIPVYNYTSGQENPLIIGLLTYMNFTYGIPSLLAIWYPVALFVTNDILFWFLSIILEVIPAIFIDALRIVTGRKPQLVSNYIKVLNFVGKMKSFGYKEWQWNNKNVQNLWKKLNNTDQELFPFSIASFSWLLFSKTYVAGLRKYILKENDETLPQAYAKFYRFLIAHYFLKATTIYALYYMVLTFFSKMFNAIMA